MALVRSLTFSLWTLLSNTFVKNIQLILSNHLTTTQKKKSRKKEIPPEIKEENQEKAKKRIFLEHVIRLIKIFILPRERFRLKDNNY
ncbi:hypothetical protein Tery_3599 [Trichodesmium erythraeum IMS101]|uniref:Uncharacterized protein n=1 Tax=Trichodesmium erythraeum (strain IMS101) TaxID=203124 RepID=Q10YJ9_TRIEI